MLKIGLTFLIIITIITISIGCSSRIVPDQVVKHAPNAPTGLNGQANSASSITIQWIDSAENEDGFRVYRDGVVVESLKANSTNFTDKGLKYGTTYTYEVSAYNDIGETKGSTPAQIKTLNPPMAITIDRIGVIKDHDPWPKGEGEIYVYAAVSDGKGQPQIVRLPSSQYLDLNDNESTDISQLIFSTENVGDELKLVVIGFESDDPVLGMIGNLFLQGMTAYLTAQYGQAGQLVGELIKSQPSDSDEGAPMQLAESTSDDFVGALEKTYAAFNNWGIGSYQNITDGDLCLGFTISLVTESGLTPQPPTPISTSKPMTPIAVVNPTSTITTVSSATIRPLIVNFDGWFVGNSRVISTIKNNTVTAQITLQDGSSGQYQMRIRADISGGEDSTISEITFNHNGVFTTQELSFIPPYATNESGINGYHVDLLKDNTSLWTLTNSYPPRLRVTKPPITSYTLNTEVNPAGSGSISSVPNTNTFSPGSSVTITAKPASGYKFVSWTGDFSGTNPVVIINMSSDKTIIANFSLASPSPLSVNFNGWFVNGAKVTTTTKNKTVVARLSLTGGTAGQYTMRIRRDISLGEDVTVNEVSFNYEGSSIIQELSFIPPYASNEASTNGYHIDLLKDNSSSFTLTNAYPPRLRVSQ